MLIRRLIGAREGADPGHTVTSAQALRSISRSMRCLKDKVHDELREKECPCGHKGAIGVIPNVKQADHFARVQCAECGKQLEWLAWPTTDKEDRRERRYSRRQVKELGDRCELCLRHRSELPKPEMLEVQHVIEKAADGTDDAENLRPYCTACHRIVNWLRTHFGHYHPDAPNREGSGTPSVPPPPDSLRQLLEKLRR